MALSRWVRPLMDDMLALDGRMSRAMFPSLAHAHWPVGPAFDWGAVPAPSWTGRQPRLRISETDKEVVVEAETPGFKKENLSVDVDGSRLVIKGLQEAEKAEGAQGAATRHEFTEVLQLPPELATTSISAQYENGVLRISLAKAEATKPKSISIAVGEANTQGEPKAEDK